MPGLMQNMVKTQSDGLNRQQLSKYIGKIQTKLVSGVVGNYLFLKTMSVKINICIAIL